MGVAEFFYPLATDKEVKDQLKVFISTAALQRLFNSDVEGFKVAGTEKPKARPYESLSFVDVMKKIESLKPQDLSKELTNAKSKKLEDTVNTIVELLKEIFIRIADINSSKNDQLREEATSVISSCSVWGVINLLRVLIKRPNSLVGPGSNAAKRYWFNSI